MVGSALGSPESIHSIGIFVGWLIATGYVLQVGMFLSRRGYQRIVSNLPTDKPLRKKYLSLMRMLAAGHSYIGLYLVTFILLHAMIELTHQGFFISGVVVLTLMLTQIGMGVYGTFFRGRKKGSWLTIHRTLAALLAIAIVIHITTVVMLHRGWVL